jgi:hypothetical protein
MMEELEIQAVELARQHAEDEVVAFEREGEVAQAAMVRYWRTHPWWPSMSSWARCTPPRPGKAVEMMVMEATMVALRAMRNDPVMVSLEAVAIEAAKVVVRELRESVVARQASVKVHMYGNDTEDEESRITTTAMVATGTTAWRLVDGDKTKVEDDDDEEVVAEAQCDAELRAEVERVKAAVEAERVKAAAEAEAEVERTAAAKAVE